MIKNIYAVKTEKELTELQKIVHKMWPELEQFLSFLKEKYRTVDLPRCIIWTDYETFSVDGTYTIDGDKIRLHMDSYGSYY